MRFPRLKLFQHQVIESSLPAFSHSRAACPAQKKQWFSHLGIRQKIGYGYTLAIGIAVLGTVTGLMMGDYYQKQASQARELAHREEYLLTELRASLLWTRTHQQQFIPLLGHPQRFEDEYKHFREHVVDVEQLFANLKSAVNSHFNNAEPDVTDLEPLLKANNGTTQIYVENLEAVLKRVDPLHLQPHAVPAAQQVLLAFSDSQIALQFDHLADALTPLVEVAQQEERQADVALQDAERLRTMIFSLSTLLSILIAAALAFYTSRAIARPLETATKIAHQISEEANFNLQIPVTTADEIGQLTDALNQVLQQVAGHTQALKTSEQELLARSRLVALNADVAIALTRSDTLQDILQQCTEALVRHLDAAFARIWTLNEAESMLELQASAGMYTHINGSHSQIPVGQFKIGLIAQERQPHLTNSVIGDSRVNDQEWAQREGMVAFAGYPLIVEDQLVGVLAMFARETLPETTLQTIASVANGLALGIQRKQAEKALQQSLQELADLKLALDQSSIVAITDSKGTIRYVNDKFCEIFQYSRAELLGQNHRIINSGYHSQEFFQQLWAKISSGQVWQGEIKNRAKDGTFYWVDMTLVPLLNAQGKPHQYVAIQQDISDRKLAEEALRESEERFRSLSACSPVGIFLTDTQGLCTYTNPCCQTIAGFTFAEALGVSWAEAVHPEDRERVLIGWSAYTREGREYSDECRFQTHEGIVRWVHVRSSPMFSDQRELIAHVGTVEDITERKQAEAGLCQALAKEKELSDLKSRFITTASHEFRTPLSIISSSAGLLLDYGDKLDEQKKLKHLQRVQSSVNYMTQLLEDVLLINRAEVGKLEFNPAPLNWIAFCRELVEELQLSMQTNHRIALQIDDMAVLNPQVEMDEKLLRQILSNLLSNAIKYSPIGSTIHFDLAYQNEAAVFQIRDEGIGIPAEDQEKLFELFHRAKNVGNIPGTGLGLAIVKKYLDLQGGKISVDSDIGIGTQFTVTIPLN